MKKEIKKRIFEDFPLGLFILALIFVFLVLVERLFYRGNIFLIWLSVIAFNLMLCECIYSILGVF